MFFIGIFGIENKDKLIKVLNNINCKNCNQIISGRLIKNFDFFHFFFIPLFKWNEKYYFICDNCKTVYSILKEKGKGIERGEKLELSYWDLQDMSTNYYNCHEIKRCNNCGKEVESNFKYCPHCGAKI
jgi:hypothetical protein